MKIRKKIRRFSNCLSDRLNGRSGRNRREAPVLAPPLDATAYPNRDHRRWVECIDAVELCERASEDLEAYGLEGDLSAREVIVADSAAHAETRPLLISTLTSLAALAVAVSSIAIGTEAVHWGTGALIGLLAAALALTAMATQLFASRVAPAVQAIIEDRRERGALDPGVSACPRGEDRST